MTCAACRFGDLAVGTDDEPRLDCRRNPPLVFIDDDGTPVMIWPQVLGDDWCGEYQAPD